MLATIAFSLMLGILAIVAVIATAPAGEVIAAGAVGNGTAASCTQAALDTALAGGGLVTFNCGADPVTITVTGTKVISPATTIDGGGKIILSGGGITEVLRVPVSSTLTLQNITVTAGAAEGGGGGGAINNAGATILSKTSIVSNSAFLGGGIFSTGPLTVVDSIFASNTTTGTSGYGGAIVQIGAQVSIRGSSFISNSSYGLGGAVSTVVATTTITSSEFVSNSSAATSTGAGALAVLVGNLVVDSTRFAGNRTLGSGGPGSLDGGGVIAVLPTDVIVRNSQFVSNVVSATLGAGGIHVVGATSKVVISGSTFDGNSAGSESGGGAKIYAAAPITIEGSTFSANSVISNGAGGVFLYGAGPTTATIRNNTFSRNNGGTNSGGAFVNAIGAAGIVTLTHNTIVSNTSAGAGFGISATTGSTVTLQNTIVAYNTGANCSGGGAILVQGVNIQDGDASCSGVSLTNPRIGPLANYGGGIPTHALLPGSPAIDTAPAPYCPPVDERGATRPQGAGCDIGAYEQTLPTLTAISPVAGTPFGITMTVELTGTNFVPGALARVDGNPRATAYLSATRLSATLTATDTLFARTLSISAINPGPGEGPSASLPLTLTGHVYVPSAATSYASNW